MSTVRIARRTCRDCTPAAVFDNLTLRYEHRIAAHPELSVGEKPPWRRVPDAVILTAIRNRTRAVVRGATGPDLMRDLKMSKRGVYDRIGKLKEAGLIVSTVDEGYALTPAGNALLTPTKGTP